MNTSSMVVTEMPYSSRPSASSCSSSACSKAGKEADTAVGSWNVTSEPTSLSSLWPFTCLPMRAETSAVSQDGWPPSGDSRLTIVRL